MLNPSINRRAFFGCAGGVAATLVLSDRAQADGRPPVKNPRATSGDKRSEPNWNERLTTTVGRDKADIVGRSDRAIQAAVDYVTRLGGGTVKILQGVFEMRNSIWLTSHVRILGSGPETVLFKSPSATTKITDDSDWYDQEVTLADASSFQVGDGVCLQTKDPHNGGQDVLKRTIVARSGNRIKLDRALRENFWLDGNPTASSTFPILTSENTEQVVIENIALDGNGKNNALLDGNYSGCIFLQDCSNYTLRNVEARNYNGDGISWQICHDVVVENCHSHDNTNLGLHPGSGSQRPLMRGNRLERNGIGIFFCWGVRYGLAEGNTIDGNREYGVSIGHCDTDNLVRNNLIKNSGKIGVLFREDGRGKDFWPHRNTIENNRILDNGPADGFAVDIQGRPRDLNLVKNEIRESREPMNRTGIRIGKQVGKVTLADNRIEGFSVALIDERKA